MSRLGVNEEEDNRILRNSLFDPPRGRKMAIFSIKNKNFIFCSRGRSSKVVVLTINFKGPFHKKIRSCILFYQKCHIVITSLHTEGFTGPRFLWFYFKIVIIKSYLSLIFSCESNSYNWVLCRPAGRPSSLPAGLPACLPPSWTNLHYSSPLGITRG